MGLNLNSAFELSAANGKLLVSQAPNIPSSELFIKGANWAGFQNGGCPHELWKHSVPEYISFLTDNDFNAVRLPLNAAIVNSDMIVDSNCSEYNGQRSLDVLDDVLTKLKAANILVVLDMHTITYPEANQGLWCDSTTACDATNEAPIFDAWATLANRFCSKHLNVIGADLFNEPYLGTWGTGNADTDWDSAATRLGNAVLSRCNRWLVMVEGASGSHCEPHGCWWGENVLGQLTHPITLAVPNRLVLAPHTYGHGQHSYFRDQNFPSNMPGVWEANWGRIPSTTNVPVIVGEWGGVWTDTPRNGQTLRSTSTWQMTLQSYLRQNGIGFFYWCVSSPRPVCPCRTHISPTTSEYLPHARGDVSHPVRVPPPSLYNCNRILNDNSFRTGSLYEDYTGATNAKLEMLRTSPVTLLAELGAASPPPAPAPPLGTLRKIQILGVSLVQPYGNNEYPGSLAIDGNLDTICVSTAGGQSRLSVEVQGNTAVAAVKVVNRNDVYKAMLKSFEIWVGDTSHGKRTKCGESSYSPDQPGQVYVIACNFARGSYVTLQHVGGAGDMLSIAEIEIYEGDPPQLPPSLRPVSPSPSPSPSPPGLSQSLPRAVPLRGDVGRTTVGGTDSRSGKTFLANENIYGPFGKTPTDDAPMQESMDTGL